MQQTYAVAESPYAGFWRRFAAIIIDGLVVGIPLGIIFAPFGGNNFNGSGYTGFGLLRSLVFLAYFALMESSSYQATLGKMALGIKVTDIDGNKLTFGRALGRNAAKFISTIICFIGYILAAFTERKQALHDMIASTLVVRKEAALATTGGYGAAGSYGAPPPPPPPVAPSSGFAGAAPPPAPESAPPPAPATPDIPATESGQAPADAPGETPPENPPTA
jgi:uncharacterized RDD family membrane protein YckC